MLIDLMSDVRNYLHINWQDDITDSNLTGMIYRGAARLEEIAGVPLDFLLPGQPQSLLLDYCRYANSQALEMFEKNFGAELNSLRIRYLVEAAIKEDAATAAVVLVEGSLLQADYDAAKILVDALIETSAKTDLTARLVSVLSIMPVVAIP